MNKFKEGDKVVVVKRHNGVPYTGTVESVATSKLSNGQTGVKYTVLVNNRNGQGKDTSDTYVETDLAAA